MAKKIEITLKKSFYGKQPKHRATVRSLGLRKLYQTVVLEDNPSIRGMIEKINYLVDVKEQEK